MYTRKEEIKLQKDGTNLSRKQGRRFEFLKNYYGVKQGNNKNRTENNFPSKTSEEIAKESGLTKRAMNNYIRLSRSIPQYNKENYSGQPE